MVSWQSTPQNKITVTHSAVDNVIDALSTVVRRHENGFDTATVFLEDTDAKNYVDKVAADDTIKIEQKDGSDASWTTLLDGIIRRVNPILSKSGNLLAVECDGAGYGLNMMVCGEQYGTESENPTLDTIREIIKDASNGVIPKWVNNLLGTATATGFSYTTYVEDIVGTMPYLYFPYKPSDKTIRDVCDVLQAIKGTNAGPHWIVNVDSRFLLTTVGAHSAAGDNPAQYWSTWWRTDQAGSTLEEGKDFVNFTFQDLAKEANYILYHGRCRKPGSGDSWTESNAANWGTAILNSDWKCTMSDESGAGLFKVGSNSTEAANTDAVTGNFDFAYPDPTSSPASWDLDKLGGKHNIPSISFYIQVDSDVDLTGATPELRLFKYNVGPPVSFDDYYIDLGATGENLITTADTWYHISFPIGTYWRSAQKDFTGWLTHNSPSWSDIDGVHFQCLGDATTTGKVYIDALQFNGWALRGARQAAAYTTAAPCKMKVITDNVAKDDSLVASDDSGLMARLAYAEYLRVSSTPIVGTFTIPIANDLLPGQQVYLKWKKKSDGTFRKTETFRVMRLIHNITIQGSVTTVDVTNDLKNANPRPMPTQLNVLLSAVRPEFQDRQATSLKTREIDITQAILEKTY